MLFMTVAAGTVVLNIIYEGLWLIIDTDKKVASSKINIPSSREECKNHILFMTKMAKIDALFATTAEEPYPFGAAHTYIAHIREYPSPPRALNE